MRKKQRIEKLENKIFQYEDDMMYVHLARIEMEKAKEEMRTVIAQLDYYTKKIDYDREILKLNNWLTDLESKVSMKFYQNVGIYEKIRNEFSRQIAENMNNIRKLEDERSKDR